MSRAPSIFKTGGQEADTASEGAIFRLATFSVGGEDGEIPIREEVWQGRTYCVAQVVAIVEGVLHGANAAAPEFAPAAVFGQYPEAWNGRPLVLGHPKVNNIYVSANNPAVIEDWGIGLVFNTRLDGTKLRCEAWIDIATCEAKGGDFLATLQRIQQGNLVDVSVGAFINPQYSPGVHNGKAYASRWASVAPDHLAILPYEQGACSLADGCGIPRINEAQAAQPSAQADGDKSEASTTEAPSPSPCCDACASGDSHMSHLNLNSAPEQSEAPESETPAVPTALSIGEQEAARALNRATAFATIFEGQFGEALDLSQFNVEAVAAALSINEVPSSLTFGNIRDLVERALVEQLNIPYYDLDVLAMTTSVVVYWEWGNRPHQPYQIAYSITPDGVVTLSGNPEPVDLLVRIQPRQTQGTLTIERTIDMTGTPGTSPEGAGGTSTQPEATPVASAPSVETAAPAASPATFADLLAAAPADQREAFEHGQRMFAARKDALVKAITACAANRYSEEQLRAKPIDDLENLAALAGASTDFSAAGGVFQAAPPPTAKPQAFAAAPTNFLGARTAAPAA